MRPEQSARWAQLMGYRTDAPIEPAPADTDAYWALAIGVLFLIAVWFDQYTNQLIGGSFPPSAERIEAEGGRIVLAATATRLFGLLLVTTLVATRSKGSLRASLRFERKGWICGAIVVTVVLAIVLNNTDIWPFSWRWQFTGNVGWVRALIAGNHRVALAFSLMVSSIASPLIEEVIFRFGLLQSLLRWTKSRVAAVTVSSLIFGAAHLGYPAWHPNVWALRSAGALTVFGVILAVIALRHNGRISGTIVVHSVYNTLFWVTLLAAASPS